MPAIPENEVDEISDFGGSDAGNEKNAEVGGAVATKEEAREHVQEKIETSIIADMLGDYVKKMVKVHQFMLTLVLRRRFLRKQKANLKL